MALTSTGFSFTLEIAASGSMTKALDLSTVRDSLTLGLNGLNQFGCSFSYGTGSGQCNAWWHDQRTLTTITGEDLDLSGVLVNVFDTLAFTAIKFLLVSIVSPDGTKTLRVGPQNTTNPWPGPFGGTGATVYETITTDLVKYDEYAGWAVTGGSADALRVYNPSLTSVSYQIVIGGVAT